ncbi:unnamed protein product [Caenorhabditis nigoni]
MLSATVKQEVPLWKQPPPPAAKIPPLPEATRGRNMDVKQYLKKFRNVKKAKIDQIAFQDDELGYVILQEIEKVPEIWQTESISRRIDPWAKVGAATFNRTGSLVNIATMTKIFHRGRCHLRNRIRTKIASMKKSKEVFLDEDLENYLWTFDDYFALRFYREMLEKYVGYCRTRDCYDANGEPICFTIEDSEDEEETQEMEEGNDDEQYFVQGEYDDMVIEERLVYEEDLVVGVEEVVQDEMQDIYDEQSVERQKNVPRFQRGQEDGQAEQLPRRRTVDNIVPNNGQGTSSGQRTSSRHQGSQQNATTPRKPGVLINQNQIQLMQQQIKERHQNPQEERQETEEHHQQQQQERIPEPQQPVQAPQAQQQAQQGQQAHPEKLQHQNPPPQPYRHYDPNTDIGFIAYNMRRIGMEHPERQQLILNTMNAYLQIFSSNLPPNTTPEDIYEFLAREYPNESGERL